jgi:glycosidase
MPSIHARARATLMTIARATAAVLLAATAFAAAAAEPPGDPARYQPQAYIRVQHPEWSKNAVIYQINTRQFTPEGTFRAAEQQLPRLKALGVDILWLMPVHPIGEQNRKGTLGSPYAVRDYFAVNPEFGTVDDLRHFVATAHAQGMHVILDWVANHTAWDNPLREQHPDWYKRDWKGDFRPTPWWDWTDIIELDYTQPGLREYMTRALRFWVEDVGVDGYRADVAGFVPLDFWNNARRELDAIRPASSGGVFMLAEWESRDLHADAFDMTYAWSWWDAMHNIAKGKADVNALHGYYSWNENFWPKDAMRMTFVSNHDKNAWEGTEFEVFGDALPAAMVLSVVGEGMPLVYNGQEAGYDHRLKFFEKDPIVWREHSNGALYRKLFALKKAHTALWNGRWGATMVHVPNSSPPQVLSFVRQNDADKVFAVFNLSAQPRTVGFKDGPYMGEYRDYFSGKPQRMAADTQLALGPWEYRVFVR